MSKPQLDEKLVELSKAIAKVASMSEYDPDAALAAFKEQVKDSGGLSGSVQLSSDSFQYVCVSLGIDKEVEVEAPPPAEDAGDGEEKDGEEDGDEEDGGGDNEGAEDGEDGDGSADGEDGDGEDGEAAPPAPPAPKEYTKNYAELWNLVAACSGTDPVEVSSGGEAEAEAQAAAEGEQAPAPSTDGADMLIRLFLATRGYGEPALRYALSCYDPTSCGGIDEHSLSKALALVTPPGQFEEMQWTHLRRAWRKSDAWKLGGGGDDEDEDGGEEEEDEEAGEGAGAQKAEASVYDGPDRVTIESFAEKLLEDEYVAPLFSKEVEVPKVDPPEDGEEEDEEEED